MVFYNTSNHRVNQVFDYWLAQIWLKSAMTGLPVWNTREGKRCLYNQYLSHKSYIFWYFPYSIDRNRTNSLQNICFTLFHFIVKSFSLQTNQILWKFENWGCWTLSGQAQQTTVQQAQGNSSLMGDLLIPFQPGFTSGVMLSSSRWNSSLALATSSWYWATILASDCAAWTWNQRGWN